MLNRRSLVLGKIRNHKYLIIFCVLITSVFLHKSYSQDENISTADAKEQKTKAVLSCSSSGACNLSVQVCTSDGCTTLPPTAITDSITGIDVSLELDSFNTNFSSNYNPQNYGIVFSSPDGRASLIQCLVATTSNACVLTTTVGGSGSEIFSQGSLLDSPASADTDKKVDGTLSMTFSGANTITASSFTDLIFEGAINVQAIYMDSPPTPSNTTNILPWQADTGTLINAPTLTATAGDKVFIANLSPPSNTSSAIQDSTTAPTSLIANTSSNTVTGYIVAAWKDSECSSGGWGFSPNVISYASTAPTYACSYTPYNSSFGVGGTTAALGCTTTGGSFLTSSVVTITADNMAVPSGLNNSSTLANLINNPGSVQNNIGGSCLNAVYVALPQTSFAFTGIENSVVYGVTAWALNAAYPTPGISLAHSKIVYTTGVPFDLASTAKTPGLKTNTTDCFVVSAASGSNDSAAVFYWRILRDKYLTSWGITPFYYKHAPTWAAWLENHSSLKKPAHFVLETSGEFFYKAGVWFENFYEDAKVFFQKSLTTLDDLLFPKAYGANRFGLPNGEFYLMGGILSPTDDKDFYKEFYPRETYFITVGGNYLYWYEPLAFSLGLQGRYITNRQEDSVNVLGAQDQAYTRSFYSVSAQIIGGVRYRFFDFPYLEPGLTLGIGGLRFREEATANGADTQDSNGSFLATGVTKYSPAYEGGAFVDLNLTKLFRVPPSEQGSMLQDVMFRAGVSYTRNPTDALSSTGILWNGGFAFLLK